MFKKKHHHSHKTKSHDAFAPVHQDHVAVPEVRTGKVDVTGEFERLQHTDSKENVVFDTLAVPEYHTGKCGQIDTTKQEKKHHKHGLFSDLAHILANGGPEK